ncbi:hypothetical protein CHKEEEPN_1704 [Methylorubrum podarium]|nr:hypothetical protein CHKEEEPN_1704 [Methylorubrum podarium]
MASRMSYYWDACMFYEWLGAEPVSPTKKEAVADLLEENQKRSNVIVTSVITHLEVLPKKLNDKHFHDDSMYLRLFDGIHFIEQQISQNILLRAREIRDYYYRPADPAGAGGKMMDSGDAIHLATASIFECSEFHTRDDSSRGSKISLLGLYDWSGNPKLAGKYNLKIVSPESAQSSMSFDYADHSQAPK